jgi:hypothetical protein
MQVWVADRRIIGGRPMDNDALIVSRMEIWVANTSWCICWRSMNDDSLRVAGVEIRVADARRIIGWHAVDDDTLVVARMHVWLRPFDITPWLQVGITHARNIWLWVKSTDFLGIRRRRATAGLVYSWIAHARDVRLWIEAADRAGVRRN